MLALPGATLHPMFSQFRPTEPNSVGFGHSQQYDFANPMAAIKYLQRKIPGLQGDFAHRFVERIARTVSFALRRPQIATCDLLAECLILVDPPISHPDSAVREKPGIPFSGHAARDKDTLYDLGLVASFECRDRAKHSCFPAKHFRFGTLNRSRARTFVGQANSTQSVRPKKLVALSSRVNVGWMYLLFGYFQFENERSHDCFSSGLSSAAHLQRLGANRRSCSSRVTLTPVKYGPFCGARL
jgi:hypothetical protein